MEKKFIFFIFIIFNFLQLNFTNNKNNEKNEIVLITDPKVLAIEIKECGEEFINLKNLKDNEKILYGPSPEIENNSDYTYIRLSVYNKIKEANKLLEPYGVTLCLYEGLRSLSLQKKLFDSRFEKFKNQFPNKTDDEIFIETTKAVSPVINIDGTKNVPAHSTGGAIDVYLVNIETCQYIDMGSHPEDPFIENISKTDSNYISEEAKKNRKLMSAVLEKVGFVNYPTEYWHWSYGDRYWAFIKNEQYAIYNGKK